MSLDVKSCISFVIWEAARQQCCRDAYQIQKRLQHPAPKSHAYKISRDLTIRRPSALWIKAQAVSFAVRLVTGRIQTYQSKLIALLCLQHLNQYPRSLQCFYMSASVSQITGFSIACLTASSRWYQRNIVYYGRFVRGIHVWPADSRDKGHMLKYLLWKWIWNFETEVIFSRPQCD